MGLICYGTDRRGDSVGSTFYVLGHRRHARHLRPGVAPRSRGLVGRGWLRLVSPVVLIGIWQLLSATGVLPASRLASPVSIAHTAYDLVVINSPAYGTLQGSLLVSSERWGTGLSLASS